MKKTLILMTVSLALCLGANAQTPTPTSVLDPNAGTYKDAALSLIQRVTKAVEVIAGTDAGAIPGAINFALSARPVAPLMAVSPALADNLIADPTLGGKINQDSRLIVCAVLFKSGTITDLDAQVIYLRSQINIVPENQRIITALSANLLWQATRATSAGDYAHALSVATEAFPGEPARAIQVITKVKILTRSSDVLSWAKLNYYVTNFDHTQEAINSVSSGFRALDLDLVRANQFIAYQKDGTGTDLLDAISLPQLSPVIVPIPPTLQAILRGDKQGALRSAAGAFADADPAHLNAAAGAVAMTLRNIDGNIVRANGFADAQSKGQPYPITELH